MHRRNLGFSLLEIAIVMTIAGIIVAGIWMAATEANHQSHKQALERGTVQIISGIQSYFANQSADINGFTNQDAVAAGIFPTGWVQGTGAAAIIHHPFTDTFNNSTISISTSASNNITLTIGTLNSVFVSRSFRNSGIPNDVCVALVQKLSNPVTFSQLSLVSIAASGGKGSGKFGANNLPLPISSITSACGDKQNNSVSVTFRAN